MKPFSRADRVAGQVQKVLSEVLKKRVRDPRIQMATISSVKMSADLKIAKIYYTTSGDKKSRQETAEGFKHAVGFLKRSIASQIKLRYMPDLKFFLDESFDYGSHIDKLLASIKEDNGSDNPTVETE